MMEALSWLTGAAGYSAILTALALAVVAHFFASRSWSALAWMIAFGVLGASFVGQREITASVRLDAERAKVRYEGNNREVAEANARLQTEVATARKAREDDLVAFGVKIQEERTDERLKTEKRLRDIAVGTVRVRYIGAKCPSPSEPDMPPTAGTGSVGDGAGIELTAAAGLDVQILRHALIEDRKKIEYLQGFIRRTQTPLTVRAGPESVSLD